MQKTILSIDCGTQSLRTIIFSLKGEVIAIERIPFEPYTSPKPGWAEQDPEVYWEALKKGCILLKENYHEHFESIAGVGVTTLRDSMINVDNKGKPLRPLLVWLDQRKAKPEDNTHRQHRWPDNPLAAVPKPKAGHLPTLRLS